MALRDDPPALALRGIAMAQLGELPRARELLHRAARGFGIHEEVAQARCVVAEAEVALAMRDLEQTPRKLLAAMATLQAHGDAANAMQARLIAARRAVLLGRLAEAASLLQPLAITNAPPLPRAVAALARAELALRSLQVTQARDALAIARDAAAQSDVAALSAEIARAHDALEHPAASLVEGAERRPLRLHEVEALLDSGALVVDACRHALRAGADRRSLARRPILFTLARALAEAWPNDLDRETLIARAFRTRDPDETHRARLRVEVGRLRALLKGLARIEATPRGFALQPEDGRRVAVLAPPVDGEQGELVALLADGAAWSTSALALALDTSQRTVQRGLAELEAAGRVRPIGRTRAQRWLASPLTGFTTILLLPASLPSG